MGPRRKTPFRRKLDRVILVGIGVVLLAYPLDWLIWHLRLALGSGMGTVNVTSVTAATLKGNRFEVYSQDTEPVSCSRSLLPEQGAGPCWWLTMHPQRVIQY